MSKNHNLVVYLLIFLAAAMMLRIFGVINTPSGEILSYVLTVYGIITVYLSVGKNKRLNLFLGTAIFLSGIILFVTNNFDFYKLSGILLPSVFLVIGIGLMMLFIDSPSNKAILTLAIIFIMFGLLLIILLGAPSLQSFFNAIHYVAQKQWLLVVILIMIILLTKRVE